jgi:hypothetical protein
LRIDVAPPSKLFKEVSNFLRVSQFILFFFLLLHSLKGFVDKAYFEAFSFSQKQEKLLLLLLLNVLLMRKAVNQARFKPRMSSHII